MEKYTWHTIVENEPFRTSVMLLEYSALIRIVALGSHSHDTRAVSITEMNLMSAKGLLEHDEKIRNEIMERGL